MNTEQKKTARNDLKIFFKLMNNVVFGKAMENKILSYRYQACSNRRKKKLFIVRTKPLKSKYFFSKNVLAIEMKKIWIPVNKPVYLRISMLKLIDDENSL